MHGDPVADATSVVTELEARAAHEREGSADGVNLLTYHRAKGLEWDAVFLPALEEGTMPIRQALDDEAALEEERRLLYVGITRARLHLVLSWAERRDTRGRESKRRPSRFLLDGRGRPARDPREAAAGAARPGSPAAPRRLGRPAVRGPARVADGPRTERRGAAVRDRP